MISCKNNCGISKIEVSELLEISANERSIDYCGILIKALNGNGESIKELSLMEFQNAAGYNHGAVLVELILITGEMKYLESILGINSEQRNLIKSYVDVGLEYGNIPKLTSKQIETEFPFLYQFLVH
ncbi:hypothetical protein MM239_01550 [Belliella sp. DSM 111904]|uniref:Uncharacterized protein n=1 Tax=Belliella filtrata TaxID=2923435 RepID=A0ABS9UV62_9BACT|nr:hypothetical protein [Belliella filtrata]MCH7408065.1 hypothetical protein [Belliella filtrata]